MKLSMWNFHSWLQNRGIPHSFSIRSNEAHIRGIRFHAEENAEEYALISDAPHTSEYQSMIAYGENHIYFRSLSALEAMSETHRMLSIYDHWEQALKKVNLAYGSLDELLALCFELMPYPIAIFQGGQLTASSPRFKTEIAEIHDQFSRLTLNKLLRLLPVSATEDNLCPPHEPLICNSMIFQGKQIILSSIILGKQPVRLIAFANGAPLSPGDIHLMRILSEAAACNLRLWRQRICKHNDDIQELTSTLRQHNWEDGQHYTVFAIEKLSGTDSLVLDKLHQTLKLRFRDIYQYKNAVLLLWNYDISGTAPEETMLQSIIPPEYFVAGQSNVSTNLSLLSKLIEQAKDAIKQARQKNVFYLSSQAVMLDCMRQALYRDQLLQSLVHPAIRNLMRIDRLNGSGWIDILRAFLFYGGNCNAAAKALHLNRNTFISRLGHVRTLIGDSLDDPHVRESLLLSILIVNP